MTSPTTPKPLRADAARNRELIIDAAGELFAEQGLGVGLDEVARRAGVGVGTVYRRFPDKQDLVNALFDSRIEQLGAVIDETFAIDDPWEAFATYLDRVIEIQVANRGLRELVFGSPYGEPHMLRMKERLEPVVAELLGRAQAAGAVRDDLTTADVPLVQFMIVGLADMTEQTQPGLWRRTFALVLEGLRARALESGPLPVGPITLDEFRAAARCSRWAAGRGPREPAG